MEKIGGVCRFLGLIGLGVLALFVLWVCAKRDKQAPSPAKAEEVTATDPEVDGSEFRAVWVSLLGPGLRSPEEIRRMCQAARDANLNTIVAQVHREGAVMFPSRLAPRHAAIAQLSEFDPLTTLLQEARDTSEGKTRLDVHAWFNVFRIGPQNDYLNSTPTPIAVAHPDWYTRNQADEPQFELDPGHPAVQDHLLAVIEECLIQYDVDGINLDYIRYFDNDRGYNPVALERFFRATERKDAPAPEDEVWKDFRRDQVTDFVRRCAISVWTHQPGAIFSANVVDWGPAPIIDFSETRPHADALQDWRSWWEQGLLDAGLLMNYKRERVETQAIDYRNWNDYILNLMEKRSGGRWIVGIGGFFNPQEAVIIQYREALIRGMDTSLFSYDRPTLEAADYPDRLGNFRSPVWALIGEVIHPDPVSPPKPHWREEQSSIAGYLLDASGEPLDGREVTLRGTSHKGKSDGSGFFAFCGLTPGSYRLSIADHPLDGVVINAPPGKVTWLNNES